VNSKVYKKWLRVEIHNIIHLRKFVCDYFDEIIENEACIDNDEYLSQGYVSLWEDDTNIVGRNDLY
jgi:hypothetical protein